jgi:hypothetical protein
MHGRISGITIAVRMDATNEGIRDYYILPALDMTWENLRVKTLPFVTRMDSNGRFEQI